MCPPKTRSIRYIVGCRSRSERTIRGALRTGEGLCALPRSSNLAPRDPAGFPGAGLLGSGEGIFTRPTAPIAGIGNSAWPENPVRSRSEDRPGCSTVPQEDQSGFPGHTSNSPLPIRPPPWTGPQNSLQWSPGGPPPGSPPGLHNSYLFSNKIMVDI